MDGRSSRTEPFGDGVGGCGVFHTGPDTFAGVWMDISGVAERSSEHFSDTADAAVNAPSVCAAFRFFQAETDQTKQLISLTEIYSGLFPLERRCFFPCLLEIKSLIFLYLP